MEDDRAILLAPACADGNLAVMRRIIEKDPGAVNEPGEDGTTPLCAAAMWGHAEAMKLLLQSKAAPMTRNETGPRWTPLHAASLQEEGKLCMMLLSANADPNFRDVDGITPGDYASCSEAVWSLFAANGCTRSSKEDLLKQGVIRKVSSALEQQLQTENDPEAQASMGLPPSDRRGILPEFSRPGSAYVVSREHPPRPGSAMTRPGSSSARPASSARLSARPIDILEEEDETEAAGKGLKSLGI